MPALLPHIDPSERRDVMVAFGVLLGIAAAAMLMQTARDALFLWHVSVTELPWVYLGIAVAALGLSLVQSRVQRTSSAIRILATLLVLCAGVTLWFGFRIDAGGIWRYYALYVWSGIFGTLATFQFWLVLGAMYTVTQAKRVYSVVGVGSVLGAIAGAGSAAWISARLEPSFALVSASAVMALTAALVVFGMRLRPDTERSKPANRVPPDMRHSLKIAAGHPYILRLAAVVVVAGITLTFADYWFKREVAAAVAPESLGTFLGQAYLAFSIIGLVAQIALTTALLRVLGAPRVLLVVPVLLLAGGLGSVLGGGIAAALLLKGTDESLRHTVDRTGLEILYLPIPDDLRAPAKRVIDVAGRRGAQALASLIVLATFTIPGLRDEVVLAALVTSACIWAFLVLRLKRHYLDLFRLALREGDISTSPNFELDVGSLEALFSALNSREDREVLAALDMLAAHGKSQLIPAMILYHPSREVVLKALEVFVASDRHDFVPVADRLLDRADPKIRAAALRMRSAVEHDQELLMESLDDDSPLVRATALVGLVAANVMKADESANHLENLVRRGDAEAKIAFAEAVRRQPCSRLEDMVVELASDQDPKVRASAARAMHVGNPDKYLPSLLLLLSDRHARVSAREAMVSLGERALVYLDQALADEELPHRIRVHLPRTVSQFPAKKAAAVLLEHLPREHSGMVRYKILRGLGHLRHANPSLPLDPELLKEALSRHFEAALSLLHFRDVLCKGAEAQPARHTPAHALLVDLLGAKERNAVERIFRLLDLLHPHEQFLRIHHGLKSDDARRRSTSRELLSELLDDAVRDALLGLVDEIPVAEKLEAGARFYNAAVSSYEAILERLSRHDSGVLREVARYHARELGIDMMAQAARKPEPEGLIAHAMRLLELIPKPVPAELKP